MHPQRVSSTSHDTPASRTRPSVPAGHVRTHRRDRTSRDLDRHLRCRQQRAASDRTRVRAYASAPPGITAELEAQAAHGPTSDRARADVVRATLTRATRVATRSPLCATRSTGARSSAGPGSTSPTGLPRSYPSGAPQGDAKSAPVSTAGRSRHRRWDAMTTHREIALRSAAEPPCQPHIIRHISRSSIQDAQDRRRTP